MAYGEGDSIDNILRMTQAQSLDLQKKFEETRERLQKKLSRHSGELVVAVSRDYEGFRMNPHGPVTMYNEERLLEVGVIGKETVFGQLNHQGFPPLISNLKSATYLHHGGTFLLIQPPEFNGTNHKGLLYLANMDEPPELPEIDWREHDDEDGIGPFKRHMYKRGPMIHEIKDSRLEIYTGDAMAVPYLKGSLVEKQLQQLSDVLQRDIKINWTFSF